MSNDHRYGFSKSPEEICSKQLPSRHVMILLKKGNSTHLKASKNERRGKRGRTKFTVFGYLGPFPMTTPNQYSLSFKSKHLHADDTFCCVKRWRTRNLQRFPQIQKESKHSKKRPPPTHLAFSENQIKTHQKKKSNPSMSRVDFLDEILFRSNHPEHKTKERKWMWKRHFCSLQNHKDQRCGFSSPPVEFVLLWYLGPLPTMDWRYAPSKSHFYLNCPSSHHSVSHLFCFLHWS